MKKQNLQEMFNSLINNKSILLKEGMADRPETDSEILRFSIEAELDAINLYDQLSKKAKNKDLKKVLLDISLEEKVHVEEFRNLLSTIDPEIKDAEKKANKEIKNLIKL